MSCEQTAPMSTCVCTPVDWGCVDEAWVDELDPKVRDRSEVLAWMTLRSLTAYQVGDCPITVRPCDPGCGREFGMSWDEAVVTDGSFAGYLGPRNSLLNPRIVDGGWVNVSCGCTTACSCTYVPEVILPGPVGRVDEVMVDGVVLDSSSYRVDDGNRLVRTDGGHWPRCQDMAADCGDPGSFCVTYVRGHAADDTAAYIAGVLAVEFAKACTGGSCRLPSGVTQVARQGVTYQIASSAFADGLTGIREVDAYVRVFNPNHLTSPPQVYSPQRRPARQTTWQAGVS